VSLSSEENGSVTPSTGSSETHFGRLQDLSHQATDNLWFMPNQVFLGKSGKFEIAWLRARLSEIQSEFDYTVIQAPSCRSQWGAPLLATLCEGLVLVIQANSTRRIAAHKVKEMLAATNTRLLGTVLNGRTFPIPTSMYKKL